MDRDLSIRSQAFDCLARLRDRFGEVLPWRTLSAGFEFEGHRVPLLGPQGIFKPAVMDLPLSMTTSPPMAGKEPPYEDGIGPDDLYWYRYRGENPDHPENAGLRRCMQEARPLIYFHGVVRGRYLACWPVQIVKDTPSALTFHLALDDKLSGAAARLEGVRDAEIAKRSYATVSTMRRLHQRSFRERVIAAYHGQCTICRLRHAELLEAAHIIPDSEPDGLPVVPNGLSLCKLHHAAYDRHVLGIRPDHVIEIRRDILEEIDGPMLKHGLQGFQGLKIRAPRSKNSAPRPEFLQRRYAAFLAAT